MKCSFAVLLSAFCMIASLGVLHAAEEPAVRPQGFWSADPKDLKPDSHVGFRAVWRMDAAGDVEFHMLGASWFVAWLDGEYFAEGPSRFPREHPQYQTYRAALKPGRHVLAVQVHHDGVPTRMIEEQPPLLDVSAFAAGQPIPLQWRCSRLDGYTSQVKRINPQLGWIEWCDTQQTPPWQSPNFDDAGWKAPVAVVRDLGPVEPLSTSNPRAIPHAIKPTASGQLVERFGYELDNPAARFFLRDLDAIDSPSQGVWRRYDLGRVRLMRPRFTLDLPRGAIVEFAYSESLTRGRVSPWITLSAGDSCNFDHYVARGGLQEFFPLTPKGGRFVEIHVLAPPESVRFVKEEVIERCYYGDPDGAFHCNDNLLNRIWSVGVETHRACAEDALIDNPTRERGQWTGDVVAVGMDTAAVAFNDLRLCRRGLVQSAQCARQDGLVSGMSPGQDIFLSTYAAQWVTACVHYWEITGELALLQELFPAADRNLDAFEKQCTPDGLEDSLGWGFVDWGYVQNPGPSDMGVNLHYLAALRDMIRWCKTLNRNDRAAHYQQQAERMTACVDRYFRDELVQADAWDRIGYHRAVLGLRLGFFQPAETAGCIQYLKKHMLRCFPNDATAPRLSDPAAANPRLITPYFAHYAMPTLVERGEMDFVLDQYRKCWGWALEDGRSTWLEVFDTRWSHCHQWAGCPTWQLSRYVLGLQPRFDLGDRHYVLRLVPGSLKEASGRVPLGGTGKTIAVRWSRTATGIHYKLTSPEPITLHIQDGSNAASSRVVRIEQEFEETF